MSTASSQNFAVTLCLFINALFLYKYGSRVSELALPAACLYFLAFTTLLLSSAHQLTVSLRYRQLMGAITGFVIVAASIYAENKIPLQSLNVDRWSVITSFLDQLQSGSYPFAATSHMGNPPGPMPVYYVIAYPFYLMRSLGLLSAAGYLITVYWLLQKPSGTILLVLLLFSPFMYWELMTRSNIFSYSVLVLIGLETFFRKQRFWKAVLFGLLLSTRSVFVLAYLVYFVSCWLDDKSGRLRLVGYAGVGTVAFALTFLPFLVIWPDQFWQINPFIVQSGFLVPRLVVVGFIVLAAVAALFTKRRTRSFTSGAVLFTSIAIYTVYHISHRGFEEAIHGSVVDVSYFLFSVPFLSYYYVQRKTETSAA